MVELFKIGNFAIYLFSVMIAIGLMIVIGMFIGIYLMHRESKRKGLDTDSMFELAMYTLVASIIGARLYYIIVFNPSPYIENLVEIFSLRDGGLSIQGGLIGGIFFSFWYTKRKKLNFWTAADAFAPGIVAAQAVGRIGCDIFGIPMKTSYPWGIVINSQLLHPAQMYEMILDLILFVYLWNRRGKIKYNGQLFINYIIGFSINRFIIEFFRTNPVVIGSLTVAHITSIVIIIVALIVRNITKNKERMEKADLQDNIVEVYSYEYIIVVLVGAIGMFIYYNVHSVF